MIKGKRFSQVYLEKGVPVADSNRLRNRLGAFYSETLRDYDGRIVRLIHRETGAKVPFIVSSYHVRRFFEQCDVRDLLDSITLIFQLLRDSSEGRLAQQWHEFVARAFREENVGYRLDDEGRVHFAVDEEFERTRSALLAGLSSQPAVQEAFQKAYSLLDVDTPDTAGAVRSVFESLEILYKHIIKAEGKERLNTGGVQKKLKPILQQVFRDNGIACQACEHMMDSLCDWIDAGHMYRHGQKVETPLPPPIELAVLFISQGAGFIRFLLPFAQPQATEFQADIS